MLLSLLRESSSLFFVSYFVLLLWSFFVFLFLFFWGEGYRLNRLIEVVIFVLGFWFLVVSLYEFMIRESADLFLYFLVLFLVCFYFGLFGYLDCLAFWAWRLGDLALAWFGWIGFLRLLSVYLTD